MTNTDILRAYRFMQLARLFDQALINLYRQSKIVGGVYAQVGNEATSTGTAMALGDGDVLFPMHRDNAAYFVRGVTPKTMATSFLLREGSPTNAKDGTGHFADPSHAIYGNVSHLGVMVPVAAGAALAQKMSKTGKIALTYIGDGGSSVGEVHEGLTMASAMKLPLILIIENNQYAYSTPRRKQTGAPNFSARAAGYGMPGVTIDGTDIEAVFAATTEACERARRGEGASIIECVTMRMRGHAEHDQFDYVPKELLAEWEKKDPILRTEQTMIQRGISQSEISEVKTKATLEIEEANAYAESLPMASPENATTGVFVS